MALTSRERVRRAINHQEADRVPLDLGGNQSGIHSIAYQHLCQYLRLPDEQAPIMDMFQQLALPSEAVLQRLHIDTRYIYPQAPDNWKLRLTEVTEGGQAYQQYVDEWGVTLRKPVEEGYWFDMVGHPLAEASIGDLERYPWPDPRDPGRFRGLRERARYLAEETDFAVASGISGSMYELAWYLRTMEQWFEDLFFNRPFAERLLDRLLAYWTEFYSVYLAEVGEYLDVIQVGDDLGGQLGVLLSPQLYRDVVKPRQRKLYDFIHAHTGAKVWYHTCGSVAALLDDLIEVGVDILNPVQVSARGMEPTALKAQFGDRLTFWGGLDTHRILPRGTVAEVEAATRDLIATMAPGGGFVFASVHNIQAEVPPQNVVAMFDTAYSSAREASVVA